MKGIRAIALGAVAAAAAGLVLLAVAEEPNSTVETLDRTVKEIRERGLFKGESGQWRTRVQLVLDANTRLLERRTYTVWDPHPSLNLEFSWTPRGATRDPAGKVEGKGVLVWRHRAAPSYDPKSVYSEYHGEMVDGRPSGAGIYVGPDHLEYEGEWTDGELHGEGVLRLPNGDEYRGAFRDGRPHGAGVYMHATGEVWEGTFIAGQAAGFGLTRLASGFSYRSEWRDGNEVASSRAIRLAQVTANAPVPAEDVRVRMFPDRFDSGSAFAYLQYRLFNTPERMELRPERYDVWGDLPVRGATSRLMGMWKGDEEIQLLEFEENDFLDCDNEDSYLNLGGLGIAPEVATPLGLNLEVQNRSGAPIEVTGIYVDVEHSELDLQPAVQISSRLGPGYSKEAAKGEDEANYEFVFNPGFGIENFGWGAAENATMRYSLVRPGEDPPSALQFSKSLGAIESYAEVDISDALKSFGADIAAIERARASNRRAGAAALGKLAGITDSEGLEAFTEAVGILDYAWKDAKGVAHKRSSPFRVAIHLGRGQEQHFAECGDGGGSDLVRRSPLDLKVGAAGYTLDIPLRRAIPAGGVRRLAFAIRATQSSDHNMKIGIQLSDGRRIETRPVNLLYYAPQGSSMIIN